MMKYFLLILTISGQASILDKIAQHETGGERNPWCMTKIQPNGKRINTAFGPWQLNQKTLVCHLSRFPKAFTKTEKLYISWRTGMINNWKKTGVVLPLNNFQKTKEKEIVRKILSQKCRGNYSLSNVAKRWHGGNRKQNRDYYKKLRAL